ncbi:helix-turn-helix domain-containing protein [Nonomuraea sp. NPDC049486]|uniref:helix-turn-helix domain-containing protein n=1 Tax=Nonomuraea sp. NPDC049486 TaxID=3155773 RepID=UPI00343F5854
MNTETAATATAERLYKRGEAAEYCRVSTRTITRWADEGKLPHVRNPGGHRRYRESDLKAVMAVKTGGS